jgi:thiamine biosynthesis lipoprotein
MQQELSRSEIALGTFCTITLFEHGNAAIYNEIFTRIREIENLMSVNIPSSDISRINNKAGIEKVFVHKDTFKVIERAVYFAEKSDGAFDPTIGPIVSLWGIGTKDQRVPSQEEIDQTLPLINWRNIELDPILNSVFLTRVGMALDLGAIAKGYAADEAAVIINRAGISRALIDLGGNIIVIGERSRHGSGAEPWRVGIQSPHYERGVSLGVLQVTDSSVVTSGVYQKFFEKDQQLYHHLFSPQSGYPAHNGLISVTIINHISMNADALSTAIFVLGYEKGMAILRTMPQTGAVFVFDNQNVKTTPNINFSLTNKLFTLAD